MTSHPNRLLLVAGGIAAVAVAGIGDLPDKQEVHHCGSTPDRLGHDCLGTAS